MKVRVLLQRAIRPRFTILLCSKCMGRSHTRPIP
jgi:hypothetical protein